MPTIRQFFMGTGASNYVVQDDQLS